MDHQPLILVIDPARVSGGSNSNTRNIKSCNFKAIRVADLEAALESTWDWSAVHQVLQVNKLHAFVVDSITAALNVVAPLKEIRVKKATISTSAPRPSGSSSKGTPPGRGVTPMHPGIGTSGTRPRD
jgi:hypothetical protein